jgi:hypothetical protein
MDIKFSKLVSILALEEGMIPNKVSKTSKEP